MNSRKARQSIVGQFVSHRVAMLEHPAYWALSHVAARILTRIEIEHCHHGGKENGNLPVTYDDFARMGIRRKSIASGLLELQAYGFIEITRPGRAAAFDCRTPSLYRLTYLNTRKDGPTDDWARLDTVAVARIKTRLASQRRGVPSQDIDSRGINAPETVGAKTPPRIGIRRGENAPLERDKNAPGFCFCWDGTRTSSLCQPDALHLGRPATLLMRRDEAIPLKMAMEVSGKSEATIRRLCRQHGLARQTAPCASMEISRVGLEMALHGDVAALEMLRSGERTAPEVRRYFDFLGLP